MMGKLIHAYETVDVELVLRGDGTLYTVHVDALGVVSFQAFRIEFARR